MTRIAHCCCGALRAEVTGQVPRVAICHCMECQRRTGSAFGFVAFFPREQVRTEGPSKVYVRRSDAGRKVEFHFCPDCGASVFWYAEFRPDHVGIDRTRALAPRKKRRSRAQPHRPSLSAYFGQLPWSGHL